MPTGRTIAPTCKIVAEVAYAEGLAVATVWRVLLMLDGVSQAEANLTWHPAWDPSLISPVGRAKLGW